MHLGVEATRLVEDWRGIGRYTRQLLRQFARLRPDLQVTIYSDGSAANNARIRSALPDLGFGPERGSVAGVRGLHSAPPDLAWHPWNKTKHFSRSPRMAATIHDTVPFHFRYHTWLKRGLQRKIERRFRETAERADLILTPSAYSRNEIIAVLGVPPGKVIVTPLSADDFEPATGPPDHAALATRFGIAGPFFLYVGANEERKNLTRLREAFQRVRGAGGPQVELVICGPPAPDGASEPGVRWVGHVSEAELRALYHAALAFVLPSLFEGFGLPILEAMASGTPVICSRATSLPEVAGEAALYFDPLDVAALADAMTRCLSDDVLRADLATRGLARARTFRWEDTAQRTLAAFDDLLRSRPAPRS